MVIVTHFIELNNCNHGINLEFNIFNHKKAL